MHTLYALQQRERASMLGRESFNARKGKRELFISREINVNYISGNQHWLLMCTCDGPGTFADEISAYKKKNRLEDIVFVN